MVLAVKKKRQELGQGLGYRRCTATKSDGTQCNGRATAQSDVCSFHSPERNRAVSAGRLKGSRTAVLKRIKGLERISLRTPEDLFAALEDALAIARGGDVLPEKLAFLQLKAIREAREMIKFREEERLEAKARRLQELLFPSELCTDTEAEEHEELDDEQQLARLP